MLDSKVNPWVATAVIVLTILAAGVWTWAGGRAKEFGGPAGLAIAPDGRLFIQVQNVLLEHDAEGTFARRHDLGTVGVERFLGGFDFFSNGDVLLRLGPDTRTLGDNLRAYQRQTNEASLTPDVPGAGMHRCSIPAWHCSPFGVPPIDFKAAMSLHIDRSDDSVYVSDSTRHVLRKYRSDGTLLAVSDGGYHFPNQLLLHDGLLHVADTNHHRIVTLDPSTDTFGAEVAGHDVVPALAETTDRRWPSHFARIGDEWWVNNMRTGMNEGGIYVFDDDWQYLRRVMLPGTADPIAIRSFGDVVLVTDWNNDRVYQLTDAGEVAGDFESSGLAALLDESRNQRRKFRLMAYGAVGNAALLIIVLVLRGTQWRRRAEKAADEAAGFDPGKSARVRFEPLPNYVRKAKLATRLIVAFLLLWPVLAAWVAYSQDLVAAVMQLSALFFGLAIFCVVLVWMQRSTLGTMIRIDVDRITLRDYRGEEQTYAVRDVEYSEHAVASDRQAVMLGQPQLPVYDRDALMPALAATIPVENRLSPLRMLVKLMRIGHPHGIASLFLLAATAAMGVWLLIRGLP